MGHQRCFTDRDITSFVTSRLPARRPSTGRNVFCVSSPTAKYPSNSSNNLHLSKMASPYQHYDSEFCKAEWRVNGIWNAILTTHFPHGIGVEKWVVAPEAYSTWDETQSLAADLCVAELVGDPDMGVFETSTPVLTY